MDKQQEPADAGNLKKIDTVFEFPAGQPRAVWIYLPPDYHRTQKRYPVVYMHDGQNLFRQSNDDEGQWAVNASLDELAEQGKQVPIVVAVAHGDQTRLNELGPWPNPKFGKAQGNRYTRFLVDDVKSYVDAHYRTRTEPADTAVMGSSMGGLISHYAIHAYPHVFGKAAMLSPSFWVSDQAYTFAESHPLPATHKLYFATGEKEGQRMLNSLLNMINLYDSQQHPVLNMRVALVKGGSHDETFWGKQFVPALEYLEVVVDDVE